MTTEANLDSLRGWYETLLDATEAKREAEERIKVAREKIEEAIGDAESGTLDGVPVIRWTFVETRRFDATLAKQLLTTEEIAAATVTTVSRPFRIVSS